MGFIRRFIGVPVFAVCIVLSTAGAVIDGGADELDELDGFVLGYLPDDIGPMVSGFAYEWEDVAFVSRTWERQVSGGYRVDLKVNVLRANRFDNTETLREFLAHYHERDLQQWELEEFHHGSASGFSSEKEVFFLAEPGVAVEVLSPHKCYDADELRRVARAIVGK